MPTGVYKRKLPGHRHSEESKRKLSEWRKGKKLSEETKKKISIALKRRKKTGENKYCKACKKSFYVLRCQLKRKKYCSKKCHDKTRRGKYIL